MRGQGASTRLRTDTNWAEDALSPRAFTSVELLLVIAVVALLMAISLPVLPQSANRSPAADTQEGTLLRESREDAALAVQPPTSEGESRGEENRMADGLLPARRIAGVVVGPDGSPVAGADVYLFAIEVLPRMLTDKLPPEALPVGQWLEPIFGGSGSKILRRARTDAAGRFAMEPKPLRSQYCNPALLVVAEGFGFGYQSLHQQLIENVDQPAGDILIYLPKMVPIRGRLLTPRGTPAKGVLVRVRHLIDLPEYALKVCDCRLDVSHWYRARRSFATSESHEQNGRHPLRVADQSVPEYWPRSVLTDADGSFRLEGIPPGCRVYLTLLHPGFAAESLVVHTRPGEIGEHRPPAPRPVPPTFRHTLKPARPVHGAVMGADFGKPVPGALVEVGSLASIRPWHGSGWTYGRTDRQGRYSVNCHVDDDYTITVYPPPESGYLPVCIPQQTWPKGSKDLVKNFRLPPGKIIRGRVLNAETGKPICGASVVYLPPRARPGIWRHNCRNPALTGREGRFAVTGLSGPGYLSVEAPDRSYLRSADVDRLVEPDPTAERAVPMSLTSIEVPLKGTLQEDVVIRLRRGRTVVLQAVGPNGEKLPYVHAAWEGISAVHDYVFPRAARFARGRVVVSGLDPSRMKRVFLIDMPRKLGAVFDITPETADGPVEVRLRPTATIVGQIVTPDGTPAEDRFVCLKMSFDPKVSRFGSDQPYWLYANFLPQSSAHNTDPGGRFTLEYIVSGAPFDLEYIITLEPLAPGERRDVGEIIVPANWDKVQSMFVPVALCSFIITALCGIYVVRKKLVSEGRPRLWDSDADAVFWPAPKYEAKDNDVLPKDEQAEPNRKTIL